MIVLDTYYTRKEVSNSDLSELWKYFMGKEQLYDLEQIYRFGNLVDAMITESERCDHIRMMVDDVQFYSWEWSLAKAMLDSFRRDLACRSLLKLAYGQKVVSVQDFHIQYGGITFSLPMRCKYDLWFEAARFGADIKSTAATSQEQFEDACRQFDYDRSRALYMDLSGADKDMIIGISKKPPHKVFKIMIDRNHPFYISGREKYSALAFQWMYLFGDVSTIKRIPA